MIVIGLTGSIGMGKSACAGMFEELGVPVHDSDATVHGLLAGDERALEGIRVAFPPEQFPRIYNDAGVVRSELGKIVFHDDDARKALEGILHPLVQEAQKEFLALHKNAGKDICVLDIPLLFETGAERRVDYTVVVSAPYEIQRSRVLERPNMNEEKFQAILARQMPDAEKRARADYVVNTGVSHDQTLEELKGVLDGIRGKK